MRASPLRDELGIAAGRKLIGYVGSLRPVKNPMSLLIAFSKIAEAQENVDLVLIGDGPLRGKLDTFVIDNNLESRVYFAGVRIPASPYYSSFDLFVQPSFSEACSLALMEAMFRDIPVVISNGGGGPEMVEDGKTGLVVPVNDHQALAAAVSDVIRDPEEASKRATIARQRIETEFSFDSMLESYSEIYKSLL